MKIAIIGSGISGLVTAYFLSYKHEVWLFEQNNYLGGHSYTTSIEDSDGIQHIDTGFIVCNKKTYPNFIKLLNILNVQLQESEMSFSVKDSENKFEFSGSNISTLFVQKNNLFNYQFWKMLFDIYRFNLNAKKDMYLSTDITVREFIKKHKLNAYAQKYYILPLISAIWSSSINQALDFPIKFLFSFLDNHGLLNLNSAPKWYTVKGGSITYVKKLQEKIANNISLSCKVNKVSRINNKVRINTDNAELTFDKVIIATHSDQALTLLENPSELEQSILSHIKYQESNVILHTDTNVLPNNKKAWASWNYFINDSPQPNLTYNMNILQRLKSSVTYCVSLNLEGHINKNKIIAKYKYSHPIYDEKSVEAKNMWSNININNIYYCGAYWGYGFQCYWCIGYD